MIKIITDSGKEVLLNEKEIFSIEDYSKKGYKVISMNILKNNEYGDTQKKYIISSDEYERIKGILNVDK